MKSKKGLSAPIPRDQLFLIALCWIVYTAANIGRYAFSANIVHLTDTFGVSHAEAGIVTAAFSFCYGVGQLINGILAKRYPMRFLFPVVLFVSGFSDFLLFAGIPFSAYKYVWAFNGLAQSCLWPTVMQLLGTSLDVAALDGAVLVMSTTTSVGIFIAYGASSLFSCLGDYRFSFLFSSLVMALAGLFWLFRFRPSASAVLSGEENASPAAGEGKKLSFPVLLRTLSVVAIFAFSCNFVRDGLQTWVPTILKEQYGFDDSFSIFLTLILPVIGIFGAFFAIRMRKRIKKFVPLCTLFFALAVWMILPNRLFDPIPFIVAVFLFGVTVMLMFASNNSATVMAPLRLRGSVNPGLLAGLMNCCCHLGSTVGSVAFGRGADVRGWRSVFGSLSAFLILVTLIGLSASLFDWRSKKRSGGDL